jgi:hypothetical protein
LYPVIPTSNQDGRQAKNRKKGDEILKKSSPLKLLSQFQPNFSEMILEFPVGFYVKLSSAVAAILVGGMKCRINFWKGVAKPLGQLQPNFCGMILGWPPSKIVSGDPDFQPRWPTS